MAPLAPLSANPALAAIQSLKREQAKGSPSGLASAGSGKLSSPIAVVGSPVMVSALSVGSPTTIFQEEQNKKLQEDESSMLREGWWAKTDAGNMNAVDEQKKAAANAYVPQTLPGGISVNKKLDFCCMFNREPSTETPTDSATHTSALAIPESAPMANLTISPAAAENSVNATGKVPEDDTHGWWTKMENKVHNEVEEAQETKGAKAAYQPQFVGKSGLTNKLDFTQPHQDE